MSPFFRGKNIRKVQFFATHDHFAGDTVTDGTLLSFRQLLATAQNALSGFELLVPNDFETRLKELTAEETRQGKEFFAFLLGTQSEDGKEVTVTKLVVVEFVRRLL